MIREYTPKTLVCRQVPVKAGTVESTPTTCSLTKSCVSRTSSGLATFDFRSLGSLIREVAASTEMRVTLGGPQGRVGKP